MTFSMRPLRRPTWLLALALALAVLVFCDRAEAAPSSMSATGDLVADTFLKASNPDLDDWFGNAVAMSGDTLVVGAPNEDSSASGVNGDQNDNATYECGAAYVFVKTEQGWAQQAYLKPSNPDRCQYFGISVDIDGDTIVVGATWELSSAVGVNGVDAGPAVPGSGAAYVFVREGGTWTQQAHLKASNREEYDYFGISVGVSGDSVVVGAYKEDGGDSGVGGDESSNSEINSGAAYVFVHTGDSWAQEEYLKSSAPDNHGRFGERVTIDDDTVVVGAQYERGPSTGTGTISFGRAHVYTRSGGAWSHQAILGTEPTGTADFGRSVVVDGDTILVGAPKQFDEGPVAGGPGAIHSGVVHVFVRSGVTWTREAMLKSEGYGEYDEFGWCVDLEGNRAVIGAARERNRFGGVDPVHVNDILNNAGAAYVFERDGVDWTQLSYLKADAPAIKDYYGNDVAISGDAVVIGAYFDDSPAVGIGGDPVPGGVTQSGAAYAYELRIPATSFCFGDGTGVACPCGNEGSPGEGCANSTGQGARLSATGTSSVANDDLRFHVTGGRPHHPGMLVQGASEIAIPFKDGVLCVGGPTERMEILVLDSQGAGTTASSIVTDGHVSPGQQRNYQFWYRDTGLSVCGGGSNVTHGSRVDWY